MKAIIVRLFVDLECASDGHIEEELETKRVVFDKPFCVEGEKSREDMEKEAFEFCCSAIQLGIRFVDKKNADSFRYVPSRNVVTAFQMPCREITNPDSIKTADVYILPHMV